MTRRPSAPAPDLLARLESLRKARPAAREVEATIAAAASFEPRDAPGLARLHDALLFLRAYPPSPRALALADEALSRVAVQVSRLSGAGVDLSPLGALLLLQAGLLLLGHLRTLLLFGQ